MARKAVLLVLLVVMVSVLCGCTSGYTTWGPAQSYRRVMIANEQVKLVQQDIDRFFDFEEYPMSGRWSH